MRLRFFKLAQISLLIFFRIDMFSQGVAVGTRIDLTSNLGLNSSTGQFAQLFVPDYYAASANGQYMLVLHLHSASWAAEDQVYRSNTNAILFNITANSSSWMPGIYGVIAMPPNINSLRRR